MILMKSFIVGDKWIAKLYNIFCLIDLKFYQYHTYLHSNKLNKLYNRTSEGWALELIQNKPLSSYEWLYAVEENIQWLRFKTFVYKREYIPLPGPPAENDPPPPISMFKTANANMSWSVYFELWKPIERCSSSGNWVIPGCRRGSSRWSCRWQGTVKLSCYCEWLILECIWWIHYERLSITVSSLNTQISMMAHNKFCLQINK